MVPTVWMGIVEVLDAELERWHLGSLERVNLAGAAIPLSLVEGSDRHGLSIVQGWGMTETSPLGTVCKLPAAILQRGDPAVLVDIGVRRGNSHPADPDPSPST